MFLITGIERELPVRITRVRGERNRRRESTTVDWTFPDFADKTVTVFTGHSDVGYENVRLELVQFGECFGSAGRRRLRCTMVC